MGIVELTASNFENYVIQNEEPMIVDFYATWCGPCKMMAPVLEEFARENETCRIGKVDIDQYPELAEEFHVMSVPTFMLFRDGKPETRVSGMMKKKELQKWMEWISITENKR